ncbi:MAG: FAD-dependent oxidoreductase [Clostridia bacterium]|nr:FAD-dependent oxidoreductase [Clostridia bacterium]
MKEDIEKIKEKAAWCLDCKLKPCSEKGCPINTNIPEFISMVKEEKFDKAYNILQDNNIFSHICGTICPQEEQCEGKCVRAIKQEPTKIGEIEKFVNEWALENNYEYEYKIDMPENNKKVAIIGSGPAGIECAYRLRKNGYRVTVYEKDKEFGGILRYGIPDFRLSKDIIKNIIYKLEKMGIKFISEVEFGKDIELDNLKMEYDAVFLGLGAEKPSVYDIGNFKNIYNSDVFLKKYNNNEYIKDLGNVVVIGGGNVAMDSARTAKRMGSTGVSILYRRDEEHMPARKIELEEAKKEGINIVYLTRVIRGSGENGDLKELECIKTEIIDHKAIDVVNSEFKYKADSVVFAIGLKPNKQLIEKESIELNEYGLIKVDEFGRTNIDKVYAGGDVMESKSTVCRAIASARNAADTIIKDLDN